MGDFNYGFLPQAEEDEMHKSRFLSVEAKPFQRLTSHLLKPDSLLHRPPTHLPTPPPDSSAADSAAAAIAEQRAAQHAVRAAWREEVLLDFGAFESHLVRIQLVHASNAQERARYEAERRRILDTAARIRTSTTGLRERLQGARETLARRKRWDALADAITSDRALRARDEQHVQLAKLEGEIAELEAESREYARTWAERREQFGRIVGEGRQMLRLIRDEKEEAERKEGMEGAEEGDEHEGSTMRGGTSNVGTPRPDVGGATPLHPGLGEDAEGSNGGTQGSGRLRVQTDRLRVAATSPARGRSRTGSPAQRGSGGEDAEMGEVEGMPTVEEEGQEGSESEAEEGEATPVDEMDET